VPLSSGGRVFGALRVVFADACTLTPRIQRLVDAVSDAIGPSLARTMELEEASQAISRLRRTDRLEKEFLALITHDMRTPLAVIAGIATNLRDKWQDMPDGERLEELDAILRNGRSLTRLVERDLQLALIDANQLPCEIAPFDIGSETGRIVTDFARTAGRRLSLRLEGPLPLVFADVQRNAQVLANLLSNALKFSPDRSPVEVEALQRGSTVHVSVRDHGRGLSGRDAARLFRKFSRVGGDGECVRGTGLGLYLCKCMVEAQGGRIWVESRPGRGAMFTYTLPVAVGAANGAG
jgi:signal transduction histidine kinase